MYAEAKGLFESVSMNLQEWASNAKEFIEFIPQSLNQTREYIGSQLESA